MKKQVKSIKSLQGNLMIMIEKKQLNCIKGGGVIEDQILQRSGVVEDQILP